MDKAIVYLRTSSKDQEPELMRKACLDLASRLNNSVIYVGVEQKSAFKKGIVRNEWDKCVALAIKEKSNLILFRFDRSFRNEKAFIEFMQEMYELHNLRVYSVNESWVNDIWDFIDNMPEIPAPFDKLLKDIIKSVWRALVQILGRIAEDESRKRGESVKNAIKKKDGVSISYKGNKWGRRQISQIAIIKVLAIKKENPNISLRDLAKQVLITDKNKNMKPISKSVVHKILKENLPLSEVVVSTSINETKKGQKNE